MDKIYRWPQTPKYKSPLGRVALIAFVVALHIGIIFLCVVNKPHTSVERSIKSILYLSPDVRVIQPVKQKQPELSEFHVPSIQFVPPEFEVVANNSVNSSDPELSQMGQSEKYSNVFDPRMRKKLSETIPHRAPPKTEKFKTTYMPDGRMMAEVGDGRCIVSFPKSDSRERGTTWSTNTVQCGKTDSEKFMDNVERDLEERKGKKHE